MKMKGIRMYISSREVEKNCLELVFPQKRNKNQGRVRNDSALVVGSPFTLSNGNEQIVMSADIHHL
jgi:hypothetical protein